MKSRETNCQTIESLCEVLKKEFYNITSFSLSSVIRKLRQAKLITEKIDRTEYKFTEQDFLVITEYYRKRHYHLDPDYVKKNFFTFTEAAKLLINTPYTQAVILGLSDDRSSLGIILYGSILLVPKKLVFELQQSGDITNYIHSATLARQMNVGQHVIERRVKNGFFKDTKIISGKKYISIKEADKWMNEISSPIQKYTQEDGILEIKDYHNKCLKQLPTHTHTLFDTWITSKISKSHGRASTIKSIALFGIELYEFLLEHLPQGAEIYDIESKIVESLASLDTNVRLKKEFVLFYNYSIASTSASPDKQLRIERPRRDKKMKYSQNQTKTIYHPETYQKYYTYVQDIESHTRKGLETRTYANMWLFVIMHLTNVWRANDIIFQMPRISIQSVGIYDFQWFENNTISITQAQIIANEVYLHFQNKLANKNLNILRFYLDPTLLLSFATAIVICELHSRFPPKSIRIHREELLGTFISGKRNEYTFSSGFSTHKHFFGNNQDLKKFSSLAMNRSTMVYFFHNTVEGQNGDTDVALELTKMVRSHSENNTTAIYVESSNQDGAINRVSINLFSRGHFGWLYNYMINIMMGSKFQSLEERTKQIINMNNKFSPLQIEGWSEFMLNKHNKDTNVIIRISNLSEEHLTRLFYNIFKGKMPSKHKEGQCFTYPSCEFPYKKSCFGCSYFIPQEFLLFEAIDELKKRAPILENAVLESVIIRESRFINSILFILSEAVKYLGIEKLGSFVSMAELNEMMDRISDKLFLPGG